MIAHNKIVMTAVFFSLLVLAARPQEVEAQNYPTDVLMDWGYQNNMAWAAFNRGDYNLAEHRFNTAIKTLRKHTTTNQRLLARSYHDLSRTLHAQKRYADAEPLAEWVLVVRSRDPKTKPDVLFDALYLLALIHREQHHDDKAEPLLRRALEIEEENVDSNDPELALTIKDLADVEFRLEKYQEADAHYLRAIEIQRKYSPELNLSLADAIQGRAKVLDQLNRGTEAQAAEAEAERIREAAREAAERLKAAEAKKKSFDPGRIRPATP